MVDNPDILKESRKVVSLLKDPASLVLEQLGVHWEDNQIEIGEYLLNMYYPYINIAESRGSGKTFAVSGCLVLLAGIIPDLYIGVFAPKELQAQRIITYATELLIRSPKNSVIKNRFMPSRSTKLTLVFSNGSKIGAFSANEMSQTEGEHFDIMVIDEAHRTSDMIYGMVLTPMMGSRRFSRIIKLGVTIGKNHFFHSCHNLRWLTLVRDFWRCPRLLKSGYIEINGRKIGRVVLDSMPLQLKQKFFPDRPDLHYPGEMSYADFLTQYMMQWIEDIDIAFSSEHQKKILGTYNGLDVGLPGETYVCGLDWGGESSGPDPDRTVLSIWRVKGNIKEKVACYRWTDKPRTLMEELVNILIYKFPASYVCSDATGLGGPLTSELADLIEKEKVEKFKTKVVKIEGIIASKTDPDTGLNYKNSMFDNFIKQLENGFIFYPCWEYIERNPVFLEAYNEFSVLERRKSGSTYKIEAPSGYHDDHPVADMLGVFAANRIKSNVIYGNKGRILPIGVSVSSINNLPIGVGVKTSAPWSRWPKWR